MPRKAAQRIVGADPVHQFGANVRRARAAAGLSQEALARQSHLHRTEVSLLERGQREPRLGTMVRIARALELPLADLLDGNE